MFGVIENGKVVYQTTNFYEAYFKAIELKDMNETNVYFDLI